MICSSSITSLGDLDHEAGTVEIDGVTSIPAETFYNLTIETAGTKTASGVLVENDLTTGSSVGCKLDMGANNLTLKGSLIVGAIDGLDLSDVSCVLTLSGSVTQGINHAGGTTQAPSTPVSETAESNFGNLSTSGDTHFTRTTTYEKNGTRSFGNVYSDNEYNYLTYNTNIDLTSYSSAELSFWHIAKTEATYDKCRVQYSDDGGSSWTTFPSSKYEGSSSDYDTRVYFHEESYTTWGTGSETPNNSTWWKQETFDMDFLLSHDDVRIRFYLYSDVSNTRAGWFIRHFC